MNSLTSVFCCSGLALFQFLPTDSLVMVTKSRCGMMLRSMVASSWASFLPCLRSAITVLTAPSTSSCAGWSAAKEWLAGSNIRKTAVANRRPSSPVPIIPARLLALLLLVIVIKDSIFLYPFRTTKITGVLFCTPALRFWW